MKKRWILWVSGGVLLLGAGVAAALFMANRRDVTTTSEAAYQAYREAIANENRFYIKEARVGFARALELDPNFAMAMLGLSRQAKDEDQAKALIKRAAREEGRLTERERLHVEIQLAYAEKRPEDAIVVARQLHEKYPDDVRAAILLAHDEQSKGNSDQAIRVFEEVLAVDPNNADAYNQIGYHYGYRGEYDKAMDSLKKYQFIASDTANPFDSLGGGSSVLGPLQRGHRESQSCPRDQGGLLSRVLAPGRGLRGKGEYAKAVAVLREGGGALGQRRHAPGLPRLGASGRRSSAATRRPSRRASRAGCWSLRLPGPRIAPSTTPSRPWCSISRTASPPMRSAVSSSSSRSWRLAGKRTIPPRSVPPR